MLRTALGIAGALVVAALVGLSFAPTASATRYHIDITKVTRGYTIHVVGYVDVDEAARTATGHLHVTVTDPMGKVIFDKDYDFSFTWSSIPRPITFVLPGANLLVTISFSSLGVSVTALPLLNPVPTPLRRGHTNFVE